MDDSALTEPEPIRTFAGFAIVRWRDAVLPVTLNALVDEAVASGIAWMADFHEAWRMRPFLGPGEGLFLAVTSCQVSAMAVLSEDMFTAAPSTGRLRFIYVGRGARSRGLFRGLVQATLERADAFWLRLRLHTDNPVAARLYESYGFKPTADEIRSTHLRERV